MMLSDNAFTIFIGFVHEIASTFKIPLNESGTVLVAIFFPGRGLTKPMKDHIEKRYSKYEQCAVLCLFANQKGIFKHRHHLHCHLTLNRQKLICSIFFYFVASYPHNRHLVGSSMESRRLYYSYPPMF